MNGRIEFNSEAMLAEFLKHFAGCTAVFNCWWDQSRRKYILEFTGGY